MSDQEIPLYYTWPHTHRWRYISVCSTKSLRRERSFRFSIFSAESCRRPYAKRKQGETGPISMTHRGSAKAGCRHELFHHVCCGRWWARFVELPSMKTNCVMQHHCVFVCTARRESSNKCLGQDCVRSMLKYRTVALKHPADDVDGSTNISK